MRRAITVGMSAPPIGMIRNTPKASDSTAMIGTIQVWVGSITSTTTRARAAPSTAKFTAFWPR